MTSTSKTTDSNKDLCFELIIAQLEEEQNRTISSSLFGNYPSFRYHRILPISRQEDNVYFVSWINQVLLSVVHHLSADLQGRVQLLIEYGAVSISRYSNRYGGPTYNFYRPKAWFPNGRFLSKFGVFQPTDDSDDTAMAFRGKKHSRSDALRVKEKLLENANGKRGRWLKRLPTSYREIPCYSTWIGSDGIYVDTDLVVLSNILTFNARYDLGITATDEASLLLIEKAVLSGDYVRKKWSLSAWYPSVAVILYNLVDLVLLDYYPGMERLLVKLSDDLEKLKLSKHMLIERLLLDSSLLKLGKAPRNISNSDSLMLAAGQTSDFSYGIIPLLHPLNGLAMQMLGSLDLFRLSYDCRAQRLAILLEYSALIEAFRASPQLDKRTSVAKKGRTRSYKPDSVILEN